MLRLTPVAAAMRGAAFDWAPTGISRAWIELSGAVDDLDIARFVATLADYCGVETGESVRATLTALDAEEHFILPGGLLARDGVVEIAPSCCCGLEDWRDWHGVKPGAASPWLGHDPAPWIECRDDIAVIWANGGMGRRDGTAASISVTYAEFGEALAEASSALAAFHGRLDEWLRRESPAGEGIARKIATAFRIHA